MYSVFFPVFQTKKRKIYQFWIKGVVGRHDCFLLFSVSFFLHQALRLKQFVLVLEQVYILLCCFAVKTVLKHDKISS